MNDVPCAHDFSYLGMQYWTDPAPRPGTGALTVRYYHAFFCRRCLETELKSAEAGDRNSYEAPVDGSTPVSKEDAGKLRQAHRRSQWS
jgi:hypothetical protein